MHINEIVFTDHLLDVGLCIGVENDGTPIIHGRYSPFSDSIYGGVQFVKWLASGVYCSKHEWDRITNTHMSTHDVMDKFGISKKSLIRTTCLVDDGGWTEMDALKSFLSDSEYVKKDSATQLARQLISQFIIKNKSTV